VFESGKYLSSQFCDVYALVVAVTQRKGAAPRASSATPSAVFTPRPAGHPSTTGCAQVPLLEKTLFDKQPAEVVSVPTKIVLLSRNCMSV
jgi:hypothetical protein